MAKDGQRAAVLRDVERMVELLAEPLPPPPTLVAKLTDWWTGKQNNRRNWRRHGMAILEAIRQELLRGQATIDKGTTQILVLWMGSELDATLYVRPLDAETDEIRSLASSIRRGVGELSER